MDRRLLKGAWEESCRALQEEKIRFREGITAKPVFLQEKGGGG